MNILTKSKDLRAKKTVKKITSGCLECSGDLQPKDEIYTLALFGKPIVTLGRKRSHVYQCNDCDSTFMPSVKYHHFLADEERSAAINSNNDIYARLMVASLTYTGIADGRFSRKEDELLEMVLQEAKEFPSTKAVLKQVMDLGRDAESYVFAVFQFAKQHLSKEKLESVIIANARMVLVDGKIKSAEKKLLKKYMSAANIKVDMTTLLTKAHKAQYEAGADDVIGS